jgi:hypothetical protein
LATFIFDMQLRSFQCTSVIASANPGRART